MTQAAFRASYSDWKVIKGRKVVQIVFEMPLETADQAYQALGGMPISANEVWCGIARIDPKAVQRPDLHTAVDRPRPVPPIPLPAGAAKERRAFADMLPAQQAGMLSQDPAFQKFLAEKFFDQWMMIGSEDARLPLPVRAGALIRHLCKVDSRAEIKSDNADWSGLVLAYRLWQREPEVVE